MKVYIAGPIAGIPLGNRAAFDMAAGALQALGHEPVDPHRVDHSHLGDCFGDVVPRAAGEPDERSEGVEHRYGCYMKADIRALIECDAAVFLPGWRNSRGASVEWHVAGICGLLILEFKDLLDGTI